jgi:hypothetical protein
MRRAKKKIVSEPVNPETTVLHWVAGKEKPPTAMSKVLERYKMERDIFEQFREALSQARERLNQLEKTLTQKEAIVNTLGQMLIEAAGQKEEKANA